MDSTPSRRCLLLLMLAISALILLAAIICLGTSRRAAFVVPVGGGECASCTLKPAAERTALLRLAPSSAEIEHAVDKGIQAAREQMRHLRRPGAVR